MMEAKGVFAANTANIGSVDPNTGISTYNPPQYPKMLYHPMGETRVVVPPEVVMTPWGQPQERNGQSEIIHQLVNSPAEEAALLAQGWHLHPADAIAASGRTPPPKGLDAQHADLQKQMANDRAAMAAERAELEALRAERAALLAEKTAGVPAGEDPAAVAAVAKPLPLGKGGKPAAGLTV